MLHTVLDVKQNSTKVTIMKQELDNIELKISILHKNILFLKSKLKNDKNNIVLEKLNVELKELEYLKDKYPEKFI